MRSDVASLSTTDEAMAHAVYLRHRWELLRTGIQIPGLAKASAQESAPAITANRQHAKFAIVDERFLYIGSLNFTNRSEPLNTELGLLLDCPTLGRELMELLQALPHGT